MTERRLTFVRTNDREKAYIRFFAKLNARLAKETDFPLRDVSPQGQNWLVLASLDRSRPDLATITASFARRKRLRIELYIDGGDKDGNKHRFEQLLARKGEVEQIVGEPMEWERLDNRRACRIAVYTKAQILRDVDSPILLEWAAKRPPISTKHLGRNFSPAKWSRVSDGLLGSRYGTPRTWIPLGADAIGSG